MERAKGKGGGGLWPGRCSPVHADQCMRLRCATSKTPQKKKKKAHRQEEVVKAGPAQHCSAFH